jgi:hypothetical protein
MESNISTNNSKNSYPSGDATKMGHISVTQAVDLDTMESNISTNNSKNSYPSGDATKMGHISVTQAVDLDTMESNIATNNAKTGITSVQSNNILNNNDKIGISLSQISAISANTSAVSSLVLAFPRFLNLRHYNYTTADIYNDGIVKFNWDGTNKQLRFWILSIGTNEYMVGGVRIWKGTTEIRKSIYISQNVSTAYKYFTAPQTSPSSSVVDHTYDLKTSYGTAEYFLCPYLEQNYPTYQITILIGYYLGWHTISIKRFN